MGILTILLTAGLWAGGAPQQASGFVLTTDTEMRFGNRPDNPGPYSAAPQVVGQTQRLEIAAAPDSCGFKEVYSPKPASGSAVGWQLETTPTAITAAHAVVLVRWARKTFGARPSVSDSNQSVVFLRPGDQVRLDTIRLPDVTPNCASPMGTLVIGMQAREAMRTLTSTDMWLVHKVPGGKEITQHVNVRGKFNAPLSFFFDGVREGQRVIDVFGEITLRARSAGTIGGILPCGVLAADGPPIDLTARMGVRRLEDLAAFQLAVEFKLQVYRIIRESPDAAGDWRFRSQWSEAASSVEMCIAEGWYRYGAGELVTFLRYSRASLAEAERWLGDGVARGYFTPLVIAPALDTAGRCGAAITNLRKSLEPFTAKGKKATRGTP